MEIPEKFAALGLTYDDVLLLPGESDLAPSDIDTTTRLTREISLRVPLVSAAMDTVTESRMAIAMAREGGIGVLHRNLSIEDQAHQVDLVKRTQTGIISNPVTIGPDATLEELDRICGEYRVSGLPVVDVDNRLLGIITNRDLRFTPVAEWATTKVNEVMTRDAADHRRRSASPATRPRRSCARTSASGCRSSTRTAASAASSRSRTSSRASSSPTRRTTPTAGCWSARPSATSATPGSAPPRWSRPASTSSSPTPPTATSTCCSTWSAGSSPTRPPATSRSSAATSPPARARRRSSTPAPTRSRSASGPGSICTTRVVTGVGVPQVTAVYEASLATKPAGVPLIADGGMKHSGEIAKALVAGADAVMVGSLLAGCEESPGELVFVNGKQFKSYRGMGSLGAMSSRGKKSYSKDRYFQAEVASDDKIVPEGIEGQVAYRGPLSAVAHQLVGGLNQSMFYVGARTIPELQDKGRFVRITSASLKESHPHGVQMTVEAPNYSGS